MIVAGREANEFYLIVSGLARAELADEERELGPGDMFGAEALHHAVPYRTTVTAEMDMRVMAFHGDELRRLCRKFPVLRERIAGSAPEIAAPSDADAAARIAALEGENHRLESAVAKLTLENLRLRDETARQI